MAIPSTGIIMASYRLSTNHIPSHNNSNTEEEFISLTNKKFGILDISFFGHVSNIFVSSDDHSCPKYKTHSILLSIKELYRYKLFLFFLILSF